MLSHGMKHNLTSSWVQLEVITIYLYIHTDTVQTQYLFLMISNLFRGAYAHIHSGTLESRIKGFPEKSKVRNFWEKEGQKPRHVQREKEVQTGVKIKGKEKCG